MTATSAEETTVGSTMTTATKNRSPRKDPLIKVGNLDIKVPSILRYFQNRGVYLGGRILKSCIKEIKDGGLDLKIFVKIAHRQVHIGHDIGAHPLPRLHRPSIPHVLPFHPQRGTLPGKEKHHPRLRQVVGRVAQFLPGVAILRAV